MNQMLKTILNRVESWPAEDQEELALLALEIEMRRKGEYHASAAELKAIDEAIADIDANGFADPAAIEAMLSKHRG